MTNNKPLITGITISVDIADKEFGNGISSFMNVQGKYPDPATLDSVLTDGVEMYFAAFKSLLSSRYAVGSLSAKDYKETVQKIEQRVTKVLNFLQQEPEQLKSEPEPEQSPVSNVQ